MKGQILILASLCLFLVIGCAGAPAQAGQGQSAPPAVEPLSPTPGPIMAAPTGDAPAAGGVVSSNGEVTPGTPSGDIMPKVPPEQGQIVTPEPGTSTGVGQSEPASPPSGNDGQIPSTPPDMSHWQTFKSDQYQFQLLYPPEYVTVPARPEAQPKPLNSIWFQDRKLANSDTANLEPPQFAIDVYPNPGRMSANDWLNANGLLNAGDGSEVSPIRVGGADGLRVTSSLLMAPNTFVYMAHGSYIYKITPLGPFADAMLASITFTR